MPPMLRKHWKLTVIAIFSLSIAMALGVIGLSILNTVLLLPPAAPEAGRLVMIHGRSPQNPVDLISYPDFQYYRTNAHTLLDIAAAPNSISLLVDTNFENREVHLAARPVSGNYFDVLGIHPFLGRFFALKDDESEAHDAVMTYSCWKRLGSDPRIAGKKFGQNTIIGVTPESFTGSFYGLNGDLLTRLEADGDDRRNRRDQRRYVLIARLKPGATRREAQTELAGLSGQLARAYPNEDGKREVVVTRATLLPPDTLSSAEIATAILMFLVLLLLLIACANVATLLLAIAVGRRQEAAIKLALGAPRWRLIRSFLRESAVICGLSGVLGYGLAAALIARFSDFTVEFPMFGEYSVGLNLHLDMTVVAFAIVLMLTAIVAAGLAPALYASSPHLAQVLSGEIVVGGTRKSWRRNALAAAQIAVCTLTLTGLGLCQRNLYNLRHSDVGFSERNLIAMQVFPGSEGYSEARGKEVYIQVRKAISALPGVEAVTLARDLPLFGASAISVEPPDGGKPAQIWHTVVDSGYFSTFGIPLLQGRTFADTDRENSAPVIVVNRKLAEQYWPNQNAIGRTLVLGENRYRATVIAVAADGKYEDLDEPRTPFLYEALSQRYQPEINVVARTRGNPALMLETFQHVIRGFGFKIPFRPTTFNRWVNLALLPQRVIAGIVAIIGVLGLLLAAMGLSGAISYAVSERRKEMGIRVALGARSWQLNRMILG